MSILLPPKGLTTVAALDPYYQGERWAAAKCTLCVKCWLVVETPNPARFGKCIHSGPFSGTRLANPNDPPAAATYPVEEAESRM